jgi:hypothetical protein
MSTIEKKVINGLRDALIRAKPDGDWMVNVTDDCNWSVNCYAKRFLLPNGNKTLVEFR